VPVISSAESRVWLEVTTAPLEDPFGHLWWVATHKEDVAPEEIQKRLQAMVAQER
jgi:hypothetical protein